MPNHTVAFNAVIEMMTSGESKVIDSLVSLLMDSDLSAQELQRVRDFVEGLKAARKA